MQAIAKHLRTSQLLGKLTTAQLTTLLDQSEIKTAHSGDIIITQDEPMQAHLILTKGELEAQRVWSTASNTSKSYTWILKPAATEVGFAFLGAANRIRARAITDIQYVLINADKIDELISWEEHFADDLKSDPILKHRMDLIKHIGVFYKLPLINIKQAFARMKQRLVDAGEVIITQGDKGSEYYLIETGHCDVIQTDPFTDETSCVSKLGPGDTFGEEALIQEGLRNATITMTTPGTLLVLAKQDFDNLLRSEIVTEVTADVAIEMVNTGNAQWLDCRYDMEYEESRLPGAPLVPLGRLRSDLHKLDPDMSYIVYCRSGRRSKAAVYLLKERNINAMSLQGGMKSWPYEIDTQPILDSELTA